MRQRTSAYLPAGYAALAEAAANEMRVALTNLACHKLVAHLRRVRGVQEAWKRRVRGVQEACKSAWHVAP